MSVPLLLIRHATPTRLVEELGDDYKLLPGPALSVAGHDEARAMAALVADWVAELDAGHRDPAEIWCSPFQRAEETARPLAAAIDASLRTLEALTEGAPEETVDQIRRRVSLARRHVEPRPGLQVVVTHGAVLREWLGQLGAVDADDESQWCWDDCGRATPCPPASVWALTAAGARRLHPVGPTGPADPAAEARFSRRPARPAGG